MSKQYLDCIYVYVNKNVCLDIIVYTVQLYAFKVYTYFKIQLCCIYGI